MTILNGFRKFDMFRQNVYLTFNGKKSYATILGSVVTLIGVIVCGLYGLLLLHKMVNRSEVIWDTNTYFIDLAKDDEIITLTKDDPKILLNGLSLNNNDGPHYIPDHFASFRNYKKFNTSLPRPHFQAVEPEQERYKYPCEEEFSDSWSLSDTFPTYNNFCFNLEGHKLAGSHHNTRVEYYSEIYMLPCTNQSVCNYIPEDQVDYVYGGSALHFTIKNKFVDLNDIQNPIKYHTREYQITNSTGGAFVEFELVRNEVKLEDSFWPTIFEAEPIIFNTLEFKEKSAYRDNDFTISIIRSDKVVQYKRQVLSFLEVSGIIGGIFEVFEIIFGALVGFYSSWLFRKDIKRKFSNSEKEIKLLKESLSRMKQDMYLKKEQEDGREERKNENNENPRTSIIPILPQLVNPNFTILFCFLAEIIRCFQ